MTEGELEVAAGRKNTSLNGEYRKQRHRERNCIVVGNKKQAVWWCQRIWVEGVTEEVGQVRIRESLICLLNSPKNKDH